MGSDELLTHRLSSSPNQGQQKQQRATSPSKPASLTRHTQAPLHMGSVAHCSAAARQTAPSSSETHRIPLLPSKEIRVCPSPNKSSPNCTPAVPLHGLPQPSSPARVLTGSPAHPFAHVLMPQAITCPEFSATRGFDWPPPSTPAHRHLLSGKHAIPSTVCLAGSKACIYSRITVHVSNF